LKLEADLLHGQKTGIYLDQRENYVAAERHTHGRVLDCFSSTGGFALHTARRAESVEAVESSVPALAIAESNARANGLTNIHFRKADVFEFLAGHDLYQSARRYSMIILDPPAFARSRKMLEDAARGYKEINLRALRMLDPGGILVTCSCSHHVSEAMLFQIVAEAALEAGKTIRVLERRTQASDHPILLTVPETLYLKCLILEVMAP
jgi:23S rRNA (cytosine1962-C5)-methyltransferase